MEHGFLVHSAKGSVWKEHKYIRKVGNEYIYVSDAGADAQAEKNREYNRQQQISKNGLNIKAKENVEYTPRPVGKTTETKKAEVNATVKKTNNIDKATSTEESSSSKKSSGSSKSSSKKDDGLPRATAKKGSSSSKSSSKEAKESSGSSSKSSSEKAEKTTKATKEKTETSSKKTTTTSADSSNKKTGSFKSIIKDSISSEITVGDNDSIVTTTNEDGSGYTVNIQYEDGSTQECKLDSNFKMVSKGEKKAKETEEKKEDEVKHGLTMVDGVLVHHGILGQKWGKKNGPPYPLDYTDLSEEERSKAKSDAIRRGDIKEAEKNKKYYTDQELRDVLNRFDLNQRLSNLNQEKIKSGMDKAKDIANKAQTVADVVSKSTNLYNSVARVMNAFTDSDLPIIGQEKKKEDKGTTNVVNTYDENGKLTKKTVTKKKDGNSTTNNYSYDNEKMEAESENQLITKKLASSVKNTANNLKNVGAVSDAIEEKAEAFDVSPYDVASNLNYINIGGEWVKRNW